MSVRQIPLELIDPNPFNSRIAYEPEHIERLSNSLALKGLLSPIMLRPFNGRFQTVFGHGRVQAARHLGWDTILAEISESLTDEEMLQLSLLENIARNDISSYETALCFQRMIKEFGKTHDEIAKLVGCSRSYVSNHLRMLNLIDKEVVSKDPTVYSQLRSISEHHARLLMQVEGQEDRLELLKLVSKEQLSVRELERIIHGLRSWFVGQVKDENCETAGVEIEQELVMNISGRQTTAYGRDSDLVEIHRILAAEFELPHLRDFETFSQQHAFGPDFSIFGDFPPLYRFEGRQAYEKAKSWFFKSAPAWWAKIQDVRVRFFDEIALATLYATYSHRENKRKMKVRGTVVFVKKHAGWKIVHEHWSELRNYSEV